MEFVLHESVEAQDQEWGHKRQVHFDRKLFLVFAKSRLVHYLLEQVDVSPSQEKVADQHGQWSVSFVELHDCVPLVQMESAICRRDEVGCHRPCHSEHTN